MGRKSHAMTVMQGQALDRFTDELAPSMQNVVMEIDNLLSEYQAASITAYWRVGKLISDVENNPDEFLTEAQQSAHVSSSDLLIHLFEKIYTPEQLRHTQRFYEMYPEEDDLDYLINLRCPERPRWRLTASHVQAITEIKDPDQRIAIIEKCAEEAFTARDLVVEIQELRGKKKSSGKTHRAPKGLKQQVHDLLEHQRRFIKRSESIWLSDDGVYDSVMNAPPDKLNDTIVGYIREIVDNFYTMGEMISDHEAMCRKLNDRIAKYEENAVKVIDAEEDAEEPETDIDEGDHVSAAKKAAQAAMAAARKTTKLTR